MFKITGVLINGRRFKPIYTKSWHHAMAINLYRGSVWERVNGHWKLIRRVYN